MKNSNAQSDSGEALAAAEFDAASIPGDLAEYFEPVGNSHCTVKPVALMRWLIRLVTQPGDVVLDPFCGSATTGVAALLEGRRFIGIERAPDAGERAFAPIARARLEHAAPSRERLATMASTPVRVEAADFGPLFNR